MNLLVLGILLAFASPLLLWPIEQIIPWPFIVEELFKAFIVIMINSESNYSTKPTIWWPILAGALFTLSESVFYLVNFLKLGDFSDIPKRLLFTGTLHIGTMILMYLGIKKGQIGLLVSFIFATIIHYLYNQLIMGH